MIRLAQCRDAAATLAICATLVACGDGSTEPVVASLTLDRTTTQPGQVLPITLNGPALPAGALVVSLGGTQVTPARIDDSTFAVVVPALAAGQHDVALTLGDATVSTSVGVTVASTVADPVSYIETMLNEAEAGVNALRAEYSNPSSRPAGIDASAFERDFSIMSGRLASARSALANATPQERAQAAAFLAANSTALGIATTGTSSFMMAASGDGACISESGEELDTYEECSPALEAFGDKAQIKLVALAALTAVAYAEGATLIGIVAAAATAYAIYKELARIQDGAFRRFITPVIGKLIDIEQSGSTAEGAQFATMAAGLEFTTGVEVPYGVFAEYRSVSLADRRVPGLAQLVSIGLRVERLMNRIRSLLLLDPMPQIIPASAVTVVVEEIPPQYLSLGPVTQGVAGTARDSLGDWMLKFSKTPLVEKLPFRFDVKYSTSVAGLQTLTRSATLKPLPMKYSGSIVVPVTQRRALPSTTCTWSGQITGTLAVEFTSATTVTAVFTGQTVYSEGTANPSNGTGCAGGTHPLSGTLTGTASNGTFSVTDGWFTITGAIAGLTGEFLRGTAGEQYDFINDFNERVWGGGSGSYQIDRVDELPFVAQRRGVTAPTVAPDETTDGLVRPSPRPISIGR